MVFESCLCGMTLVMYSYQVLRKWSKEDEQKGLGGCLEGVVAETVLLDDAPYRLVYCRGWVGQGGSGWVYEWTG